MKVLVQCDISKKTEIKSVILFEKYYENIKDHLYKTNVTFETRFWILLKFIQFITEHETVCIQAFKPLTGSQSIEDEVIDMYNKVKFSDHLISEIGIGE